MGGWEIEERTFTSKDEKRCFMVAAAAVCEIGRWRVSRVARVREGSEGSSKSDSSGVR